METAGGRRAESLALPEVALTAALNAHENAEVQGSPIRVQGSAVHAHGVGLVHRRDIMGNDEQTRPGRSGGGRRLGTLWWKAGWRKTKTSTAVQHSCGDDIDNEFGVGLCIHTWNKQKHDWGQWGKKSR